MREPIRSLSSLSGVIAGLAILGFVMAFPALVVAQSYTGSITGTVTDPSGGIIVNAQVNLTDEQKGYKFASQTDSAGRYLFRNLPTSSYRVEVQMAGFQTQVKTG